MAKDRTRHASIATNDPENDPTPRVALVRERREDRYVWIAKDGDDTQVAEGRTAREADAALEYVYSFSGWDLRFGLERGR